MQFFKNIFKLNRVRIFVAIPAILLIFFASTHVTHAAGEGLLNWLVGGTAAAITGVGSSVVGLVAFVISYLIAAIAGILIAIEAWLIGVVLSMNAGVLQTAIVQTGFSVTLSVVNLVFVLGIIVVALATILRNEAYGIKKLLWKLVVMAIFVNFGLVIIAPILGFSDSLSQYFLNCVDPAAGGCTGTGNGVASYNNFAVQFAGSFQPQKSLLTLNTGTSSLTQLTPDQQQKIQGSFSALGTSAGDLIVPLFGILAVAFNLILVVVVLAVFIVMMLIRYIYIAILAVILPIAWVSWVFPSFQSHWSKWWTTFIRWAFFPPIVLFFIYLALITMNPSGSVLGQGFTTVDYVSSSNVVWGSISGLFTNLFSPLIQAFLQEVVLAGLIIGGMIAANSMGIKMAGTIQGAAAAGGKAVKNWAQKKTVNAGTRVVRRAWQAGGGQNLTDRLRRGDVGRLANIPLVGGAIKSVASATGRGMASIQTNQAMVDEAKKRVPKDKDGVLANLKGSMNEADMFAHLSEAVKGGYLAEDTEVNGSTARVILDDKKMVARNGQGGLASDADKVFMSNTDMRNSNQAIKSYDAAIAGGVAPLEAEKLLDIKVSAKEITDQDGNIHKEGDEMDARLLREAATGDFVRNLGKADYGKANMKAVYGKKDNAQDLQAQEALLRHISINFPAGMANILNKMKAPELNNVSTKYPQAIENNITMINDHKARVTTDPTLTGAQKATQIASLDALIKRLGQTKTDFGELLFNNTMYAAYDATAGGAGSTPGGGAGTTP